MKPYRCRYSLPLSMNDSHRAVKRITRTRFCRRCVSGSADTLRRKRREEQTMNKSNSDALVFFGATGDLAFKKIFPALQAMMKRGNLRVPVIGVAKAGWKIDQLRARAHESLEKYGGGVDRAAFENLCSLLRYVDGDYRDAATYVALRKELKNAQRPVHYLAIPPALFAEVIGQLSKSGCATGAR